LAAIAAASRILSAKDDLRAPRLPLGRVLGKVRPRRRGTCITSPALSAMTQNLCMITTPVAGGSIARRLMVLAALVWLAVMAPVMSGCSHPYIPNTDVADTPENRKIISFCEQYRKAVSRKDVAELIRMASPDYYEDGGNVDASDDIDYAGLQDYLTDRFQDAKSIRYEIRYRRVSKERDRIYVDYTFTASWRIIVNNTEQWQRKVDDNRLELVPKDDAYVIVGGM
jgi:hypothetical protein